jgi:hypothetical protein
MPMLHIWQETRAKKDKADGIEEDILQIGDELSYVCYECPRLAQDGSYVASPKHVGKTGNDDMGTLDARPHHFC